MKRMMRLIPVAAAVLVLSGCAVDKAGCDPRALRDAGLLTKMNCDFSGSYDARAKDKEAQLAEAQKTNAALREALVALEKKSELSKADATARRNQISAINRSVNNYLQQVRATNPGNEAVSEQIRQATARLNQLNATPVNASAANAQELQNRVTAVQQEIEKLQRQSSILTQ
jgi:chromosome segregation ATPase